MFADVRRVGFHPPLFMSPTLGFDIEQRNSFLIKFGVLYNKNKILTKIFIVKYEKITLSEATEVHLFNP